MLAIIIVLVSAVMIIKPSNSMVKHQHYQHSGPDNSLLWGLSCALRDV